MFGWGAFWGICIKLNCNQADYLAEMVWRTDGILLKVGSSAPVSLNLSDLDFEHCYLMKARNNAHWSLITDWWWWIPYFLFFHNLSWNTEKVSPVIIWRWICRSFVLHVAVFFHIYFSLHPQNGRKHVKILRPYRNVPSVCVSSA